jgi:Tol biopolymer transport system component
MNRTILVVALLFVGACTRTSSGGTAVPPQQPLSNIAPRADEPHLTALRMLTNGGENAEAYFSADARRLIFQATRPGVNACDQIFTMNTDGSNVRMVSSGKGRTTCAYFFPSGERILYSSTHETAPECPAPPDMSQGYVWALYPYRIYSANPDGSDIRLLTGSGAYDAEATISPDGSRIVFTSTREGDLDIYTMNADGSDVRRLTNEPGYDGGAFFSWDGTKIVYRASRPQTPAELADYRRLLAQNLVRPSRLDIYIMNADGSDKRRLTDNGAANFAPFMHPDGRRVIFSSNMNDPQGRNFDLYLINVDGTGLERVTTDPDFDGFPMFSRDGRTLVFASNRQHARAGDTNVFVAQWRD